MEKEETAVVTSTTETGVDFRKMSTTQKAGALMLLFTIFSGYSLYSAIGGSAWPLIKALLEFGGLATFTTLLLLNKKKAARFAGLALAGVFAVLTIGSIVDIGKQIFDNMVDNSLFKYNKKYIGPEVITLIRLIFVFILNLLITIATAMTSLPAITKKETSETIKKIVKYIGFAIIGVVAITILISIIYYIVYINVYTVKPKFGASFRHVIDIIIYGIIEVIYLAGFAGGLLVVNGQDLKKIFKK